MEIPRLESTPRNRRPYMKINPFSIPIGTIFKCHLDDDDHIYLRSAGHIIDLIDPSFDWVMRNNCSWYLTNYEVVNKSFIPAEIDGPLLSTPKKAISIPVGTVFYCRGEKESAYLRTYSTIVDLCTNYDWNLLNEECEPTSDLVVYDYRAINKNIKELLRDNILDLI